MSIELPKYTIQAEIKNNGNLKKILLPVLILFSLAIGYFGSGLYANNTIHTLRERNDVLESINTKNLDKIAQLDTEISLLSTEKKIKQEAIVQVQNDYKNLIENQNHLKSEINFYERLLSPNIKNKGLRVFEATARRQAGDLFNVKVILVQKLERAKEISGTFQIMLSGHINTQPKTVQISNNDDSSYKFKYFHNISLGFSMPEGFKVEQLVVKLFPKSKKAKNIEYTIDWHTIIN
ncbi:MAG: hypothetical protein JKY19_12765 [Alcanivoracaceae bacterium]|nr:hypothetical protein [Alcanivoracaceae bacterium]